MRPYLFAVPLLLLVLHHVCLDLLFVQSLTFLRPCLSTRAFFQAYSGVAAALLEYAGAMRVDLQPGDTLYLPALWLHDIETVAVAGSGYAASDGKSFDDQDEGQWPVSVSYACRFEPRCLRHPPKQKQKRKRERAGAARQRQQPGAP